MDIAGVQLENDFSVYCPGQPKHGLFKQDRLPESAGPEKVLAEIKATIDAALRHFKVIDNSYRNPHA